MGKRINPTIYLSKIHILQKNIVRLIIHVEFISHTYILFKVQQIMNIYKLNKYVTCILMYKHNKGLFPNIFNDMFMNHTPSHNYNMRQHVAYKKTHCKTNTKQNTLTYIGPTLWNTVIMKNRTDECLWIYLKRQRNNTPGEHINKKHCTIRIQWYNSV